MRRIMLTAVAMLFLGAGCVESRVTHDIQVAQEVASSTVKTEVLATKKLVFKKQIGIDHTTSREFPIYDIITSNVDGSNVQTVAHHVGGKEHYAATIKVLPHRHLAVVNTEYEISLVDLVGGGTKKIYESDAQKAYIFSTDAGADEQMIYFAVTKGTYGARNVPVEVYGYDLDRDALALLTTIPASAVKFDVAMRVIPVHDEKTIYLVVGNASEQPPWLISVDRSTGAPSDVVLGLQSDVIVSPDGTTVAMSTRQGEGLYSYVNDFSSSWDSTSVTLRNMATGENHSVARNHDMLSPIAWSPDETQLLLDDSVPTLAQPYCPNNKVTTCCKKGDACDLGVVDSTHGYALYTVADGTYTDVLDSSALLSKWDPLFVNVEFGDAEGDGNSKFTIEHHPYYDPNLSFLGTYFAP